MVKETGDNPQKGLVELLGRALTDKDLRAELQNNPDELAKRFDLTEKDVEAISKLDSETLEEAAEKLAGRAEWTIKVVISKSF
ncbi:hypothetical protein SAMN04488030_3049 [Aliiroseovarius halocynthiae]|uniref:Uncharacterized protein n=1 Tax=Aliiroseovarius halocynthiae TaxID=985055 RepID=A0A545SMK6_9RHOB|nr:Os1348 family NHLP clan protein [Aliiroseovarius halocynthiae]TQV66199.1 hypothetical protein FIL88_14180 [Aliiroseovarius halocynthiae]SMR82688.1 hypothetical protein SAMN04488030_3049 [Aliiroseovarius halocynthiae]